MSKRQYRIATGGAVAIGVFGARRSAMSPTSAGTSSAATTRTGAAIGGAASGAGVDGTDSADWQLSSHNASAFGALLAPAQSACALAAGAAIAGGASDSMHACATRQDCANSNPAIAVKAA